MSAGIPQHLKDKSYAELRALYTERVGNPVGVTAKQMRRALTVKEREDLNVQAESEEVNEEVVAQAEETQRDSQEEESETQRDSQEEESETQRDSQEAQNAQESEAEAASADDAQDEQEGVQSEAVEATDEVKKQSLRELRAKQRAARLERDQEGRNVAIEAVEQIKQDAARQPSEAAIKQGFSFYSPDLFRKVGGRYARSGRCSSPGCEEVAIYARQTTGSNRAYCAKHYTEACKRLGIKPFAEQEVEAAETVAA